MAVHEVPTTELAGDMPEHQQLDLPLLEEAEAAYIRDLPALLETWPEYWVAYHGKERLGISYYPKRLRRRFALPPEGRVSLWERWFGSKHPRYPEDKLTLYFIDTTLLCDDYEITSEQWFDEPEPPAVNAI
jgi:hypothetical protein